jgi:hypothetical protein
MSNQVSLKLLLSKITTQLKNITSTSHSLEWCMVNWTAPNLLTGYNTRYTMSSFGSGNPAYLKSDSNIFIPTSNGIQVTKSGKYFVQMQGHINCSAGMYIKTTISKYANSTTTDLCHRWASDFSHTWVTFNNFSAYALDAGDELRPTFLKDLPTGTSTSFRPTTTYFFMIYLGP